jgi:hypothetical protein
MANKEGLKTVAKKFADPEAVRLAYQVITGHVARLNNGSSAVCWGVTDRGI